MRTLDLTAAALIAVMMLGPLAMAPAYGPYVEPGAAAEFDAATTPLEEGSTGLEEAAPADAATPN